MRVRHRSSVSTPKNPNSFWKVGVGFIVLVVFFVSIAFFLREYRASIWQPPLPLTVAIIGNDRVAVLSYDPSQAEGTGILIPGNVLISVVGSSGEFKANTLWRYGTLQGKPLDISKNSLSYFLGLEIDGTIYDPNWKDGNPEPEWNWLNLMRNGGSTQLSMYDRLKLIQVWNKLRPDQKKWIDLPVSLQKTQTLPDGSTVQTVDVDKLQTLIKNRFKLGSILEDRRTISITNNSGLPGAARLAERFLTNVGAIVVEVTDGGSASPGWCRYNTDKNTGGIIEWLTKRLDCVKDIQIPLSGRADIQVMLDQGWGEAYKHN